MSPIKKHTISLDGLHEEYILKFKDRPDRSGIRIHNKMEGIMEIKEIKVYKVPRETNKIIVELVKVKPS